MARTARIPSPAASIADIATTKRPAVQPRLLSTHEGGAHLVEERQRGWRQRRQIRHRQDRRPGRARFLGALVAVAAASVQQGVHAEQVPRVRSSVDVKRRAGEDDPVAVHADRRQRPRRGREDPGRRGGLDESSRRRPCGHRGQVRAELDPDFLEARRLDGEVPVDEVHDRRADGASDLVVDLCDSSRRSDFETSGRYSGLTGRAEPCRTARAPRGSRCASAAPARGSAAWITGLSVPAATRSTQWRISSAVARTEPTATTDGGRGE